jgi:RNA polymerase sigma-70 factor (ECF subfamily)
VSEFGVVAPRWNLTLQMRITQGDKMSLGLRLGPRRAGAQTPAALRRRTDAELMTLAKDGNADAFEVIYERHSVAAYSLAYRMCGKRGVAEDAVQDAFLSLWRNRHRYAPERGEPRSWLLGIVHNCAIDRLRRVASHDTRRASSEGLEQRLEDPERTDDLVAQRAQAGEVRAALDTLPPEQRQVVELAYYGGLSHREIASRLDAPVGTVKGRMRLALLKLQTQLATAGEVEL